MHNFPAISIIMLGWEPGNGPGDGHKAQNVCTWPVTKRNKIPTKLFLITTSV